MTTINFSAGTVVPASWLNDVDALVYDIFNTATTDAEARTNLGFTAPILDRAAPGAIGATTPAAITGTTITGTSLVSTGSVDISAAGAGQIVFPATQNASTNVNTLDDYEEGTWTPVITFDTAGDLAVVYSTQTGVYQKFGRWIDLQFAISTSTFTHTTASGELRITGIPVNVSATTAITAGPLIWAGITKANYTSACVQADGGISSYLQVRVSGSGQALAIISTGDMPTGGNVRLLGSVRYRTAS